MNTAKEIQLIISFFKVHLFALVVMSFFRFVFFLYYGDLENISFFSVEVLKSFFLGFRLDLTVVGYIQSIPTIILLFCVILNIKKRFNYLISFFKIYFFVLYSLVSCISFADFGFFSFFKERINLLFFGIIDDDTSALLVTILENYSVVLIVIILLVYFYILWKTIFFSFSLSSIGFKSFSRKTMFFFIVALFLLNFIVARGSFGMYPLGKMVETVSSNEFINSLSLNSMRLFIKALKQRNRIKAHNYDLLQDLGFRNNITRAFKVHLNKNIINEEDLLSNITYKTKRNQLLEEKKPNVLVIMVESFGLPPLEYQSEQFDIMRSLKKHFEEDVVYKNFISSGNGTIPSLESLMLNIPLRPNTLPFVESGYLRTPFTFSPAFVYKKNGYQTSFVYGGDASWRNIGKFAKVQGYDSFDDKTTIFQSIDDKKQDLFHPWGIYDKYLMNYIFQKLQSSNKPQFLFALTTNNHPPYNIPKDYVSKKLHISKKLQEKIIGDKKLAIDRFYSFQYALDSLGIFLDNFKKSPASENTIVVVTADNHTTDGIMKYDKDKLLNSRRIPFYIYLPKYLKKLCPTIDSTVFGSHKDIFPTLYNLSLSDSSYIAVGSSLLNTKKRKIGFNSSKILVSKDKQVKLKSFQDNTLEIARYYLATLAVTEYLISQYGKKK